MSKLYFETKGKIKGRWEVSFTQADHAYLQCQYQNVGTIGKDWPIVRGASIYSTFHFYLVDGRWTCNHPDYKSTKYFSRVMDLTPPTKGMEEALTAAVEAEFHDWALTQKAEICKAQIEHLQENIEKARKELEELASALTDKSKELEGYKRELREFMLTDVQ
jgi:hypothetical protein